AIVRRLVETLDLITFFTAGEKDTRAWTLRRGSSAIDAAGTIHSDIARGFIRCEVVRWDDLVAAGGHAEAARAGKQRLEGKTYVVEDGDVLNVRFHVSASPSSSTTRNAGSAAGSGRWKTSTFAPRRSSQPRLSVLLMPTRRWRGSIAAAPLVSAARSASSSACLAVGVNGIWPVAFAVPGSSWARTSSGERSTSWGAWARTPSTRCSVPT